MRRKSTQCLPRKCIFCLIWEVMRQITSTSLDMSRIETCTRSTRQFHYRSFLSSSSNSLCQTHSLRVQEHQRCNIERVWTHDLLYEVLSTTPTTVPNVKETWQFETRNVTWNVIRWFIWFLKCISKDKWTVLDFTSLNKFITGFQRLPLQRKDNGGKENSSRAASTALNRHWYLFYNELNGIFH